jgi:hypothetical protein
MGFGYGYQGVRRESREMKGKRDEQNLGDSCKRDPRSLAGDDLLSVLVSPDRPHQGRSAGRYSFTALRAAGATVGALIVAKAVLVVEALPIARLSSSRRIFQILWRTLLYGVVTLLFRFVEEFIPLLLKHGGLVSATKAMTGEVSWALFAVLALWILWGLFLYSLASELVRAVGPDKVKEALFSGMEGRSGSAGDAYK